MLGLNEIKQGKHLLQCLAQINVKQMLAIRTEIDDE